MFVLDARLSMVVVDGAARSGTVMQTATRTRLAARGKVMDLASDEPNPSYIAASNRALDEMLFETSYEMFMPCSKSHWNHFKIPAMCKKPGSVTSSLPKRVITRRKTVVVKLFRTHQ